MQKDLPHIFRNKTTRRGRNRSGTKMFLKKKDDRKNHGRRARNRRGDKNRFRRRLEGIAGGVIGFEIMLPYFEAEIIPKILIPGLVRYHLDEKEARANCRALIEAQMMSMRLHAGWMKLKPKVIYATGGVSHNKPILQIAADVHNCVVERSAVGKSTALGAALIAFHAVKPAPWKEVVKGFTDPVAHFRIEPNPEAVKVYEELLKKYAQFEKDHLRICERTK